MLKKRSKPNILEGNIKSTLIRMALGMLVGFLAMSAFNAADTYFVGRLGALELAAMSYTFPVVMIFNSIALGLGVGLSSTVSRALGSKDIERVRHLASNGLLLAFLIVLIMGSLGIVFTDSIFSTLGASDETLELIKKYMLIWFIGTPFVVIPMAGNNVIRATGDTATASKIMLASVFVNIILDPLLIFGVGPFPQMGISGAALATVIARFTTLIFSLSILIFKEKLVVIKIYKFHEVLQNWKEILFVGIPAALIQVTAPLTLGIITRVLAGFGDNIVAGFGSASKLEMILIIVPMAFSSVMAPFSGQNFGAKQYYRIKKGLNFTVLISLIWGLIMFILLQFTAEKIISLFNRNPEIIATGSKYLKIIALSYGFLGVLNICAQSLNALNKPIHSALITVTKSIVINIPLALVGAYFFKETGVFYATFIANTLGGLLAYISFKYLLKTVSA